MTADLLLLLTLAANTLMLSLAPTLSRPGVFFGVSVTPDFRQTEVARACVRHYRMVVILGAAIVLLVMMTTSPSRVKALAHLAHLAGVFATWVLLRRRVLPYAQPVAVVRSASVAPRDTSIPGGPLALCGPFIIVGLAALYVYTQWAAIPDQFESMARGAAGRFVPKSVRTVFGPFVFTAALIVAFTLQTVLLLKRTRQIAPAGPSFDAETRFKRRTVQQSLLATYLLAVGSSWFATQRVLNSSAPRDVAPASWALWIGVILLVTLAFTIWMIRVGQGGQRQVPAMAIRAGDATPDAAWKGGLLYFNPADPAVLVETRLGVGWSLNFGNVWSWVLIGCGIGLPLLVLRLMR